MGISNDLLKIKIKGSLSPKRLIFFFKHKPAQQSPVVKENIIKEEFKYVKYSLSGIYLVINACILSY